MILFINPLYQHPINFIYKHAFHFRCLTVYNNILGDLSKHFITNVNSTAPRHVLVNESDAWGSHLKSYFQRVSKMLHQLSEVQLERKTADELVMNLKLELSLLVTAFTSASNHLRGGLLGSLKAVNMYLCPPHH